MPTHRVFGAGLIGGYLAGALLARGESVSVVARGHARDRLAGGLRLTDLEGHEARVSAPRFYEAGEPSPDFLWLTVKCTQVEDAVASLPPHVGSETVLICCQNGLGSEEPVRKQFPAHTVLRAMVAFNVAEPGDGHLHRGSGGTLTIEHDERVRALVAAVDRPLMPVELSQDIEAVQWAKLQLNLVNAINALADVPVREMLHQRGFRRAFAAAMRELLAVTAALGLRLPQLTKLPARLLPGMLSLPDGLFRLLARPMLEVDPTVRTSMWWDLSQGKPTEIGFLNGAVVGAGGRLGIATPVNERVLALVRSVERGERRIGLSPDELLQALGLE